MAPGECQQPVEYVWPHPRSLGQAAGMDEGAPSPLRASLACGDILCSKPTGATLLQLLTPPDSTLWQCLEMVEVFISLSICVSTQALNSLLQRGIRFWWVIWMRGREKMKCGENGMWGEVRCCWWWSFSKGKGLRGKVLCFNSIAAVFDYGEPVWSKLNKKSGCIFFFFFYCLFCFVYFISCKAWEALSGNM